MTIPPDIQKAAAAVYARLGRGADADEQTIAKALMAEREACAVIADKREAICADAVAKIEAGELYRDIPTAAATESCARLEAAHIARLIRRDPGAAAIRSPQPSPPAGA